jgi:hypothetical protein
MRISKKNYELKDSAPCVDCYESMRRIGVKTIVYSTSSGAIVKSRLSDYSPSTYSLGRRFIMNDCHEVNRCEEPHGIFAVDNPLDAFMRSEREQEEVDIESIRTMTLSDMSSISSRSTSEHEFFAVDFTDSFKGTRRRMFKKRRLTLYFDSATRTQKACFV